MEIIDYIDVASTDPATVAKAVLKYIDTHKDVLNSLDTKIRISLCRSSTKKRTNKADREAALQQLIGMAEKSKFEDGKYNFDFALRKYMYNGRELYVTPGEEVALFQQLVRKQKLPTWPAFYSNMRAKFGEKFLKEIV